MVYFIRDDSDDEHYVDYVHVNPLKRGHINHVTGHIPPLSIGGEGSLSTRLGDVNSSVAGDNNIPPIMQC